MASHIIDKTMVTISDMWFFNPVRLERNTVWRGDTPWLQRRQPERLPYNKHMKSGHEASFAKATKAKLRDVATTGKVIAACY
jgi:hypothetical protein